MSKTASKRSTLFTAFFVFFIDNFGYAFVYSLFAPLLLKPEYGILSASLPIGTKNLLLGILFSAYPLTQFFGAPFFGDLADQWGRKKVFYWTLGGIALGYLLTGVFLLLKSYWGLLFSRLFTGFFAGNWSIAFATIADLSIEEKERAKNFAWTAAIGGISWVIAVLVGGDLTNPHVLRLFNPTFPFWISAALSLLALLCVFLLYEDFYPKKKSLKIHFFKGVQHIVQAFKLKGLRVLFAVLFLYILGWMMAITWFSGLSIELYHTTQSEVTWILVILGIIWGLSSFFLSPLLIRHFSIINIVIVSLFFLSLFLFLSGVSFSYLLFSIFFLITPIFATMSWSNVLNLISTSASSDQQGITMGLGQSMTSFAQLLSPLLGGIIADFSLKAVFIATGIIVFLAFLLLLIRRLRMAHE